jgi:uncharacterized protein YwgA
VFISFQLEREKTELPSVLLIDESEQSNQAENILRENGITFLTVKPDGLTVKSSLPVLLVRGKRYAGLQEIQRFASGSHFEDQKRLGRLKTTLAVLEELGISRNMFSFQQRLRLQKVIFLLQQYGLQTHWGFNWYLRGPYSPALAHELFESLRMDISGFQLSDRDLRAIEKLRKNLDVTRATPSELEAASAILYLRRAKNQFGYDLSDLIEEVKHQKPLLPLSLIKRTARKLLPEME